jgi:hypothetical protein
MLLFMALIYVMEHGDTWNTGYLDEKAGWKS